MFMASSATGSWPRAVILTVLSAVFICGETDVTVPWTMVPETCQHGPTRGMVLQSKISGSARSPVPFFSSMVTVSFAHFMRKLPVCNVSSSYGHGSQAAPGPHSGGLPNKLHRQS